MVRADPETVERRLSALRTNSTFVDAAVEVGEALSTFKTWVRRNDAFVKSRVPGFDYDNYLQLTPGEIALRKQSLKKATEAARKTVRKPKPAAERSSRVHVIQPTPIPTGTLSLTDAMSLIAAEVERVASMKDEINLLRAENEALKRGPAVREPDGEDRDPRRRQRQVADVERGVPGQGEGSRGHRLMQSIGIVISGLLMIVGFRTILRRYVGVDNETSGALGFVLLGAGLGFGLLIGW